MPSKFAHVGDVLISVRAPVGTTNLADAAYCIGRGLAAIRPLGGIPNRYLLYGIRASLEQLTNNATGTTFPAITGDVLRRHTLPIPPLAEQQRIVDEIEKQFTRLDAAVEALRTAQAKLKRYRASVLNAAVTGRLVPTEAALARAEGRDYEHASVLLERIERERTEQERDKPRRKRPAHAPVDESHLPELPEGWVWTTLESLTQNFDGQRVPVRAKDRARMHGPYPYYGASGIIDAVDNFLFDGEFLLIAEDGANLLSRTTPIAFIATGQFWVNNHAHVVKAFGGVPLQYLEAYANGMDIHKYITGSAQPKLTQAALNRIPTPLPPLAEQYCMVAEVEQRLSVVQQGEAAIETNLKRAERLRQAILKRAFEGRLVPQDPDDEPAAVLLERIKREKAAQQPSRRGRGTAGRRLL